MSTRFAGPPALVGALVCLLVSALPVRTQNADTSQSAKIEAIGKVMAGQPSFGVTDSATVAAEQPVKAIGQNIGTAILRVIIGLGVTVVLILALGWGIRRLGLVGRSKMSGGSMDFLEALPLGQNRTIVLVRVLDRVYLLGQTPDRIAKLETFEGDKALEIISSSKGGVSITHFKDVFSSFMRRGRKPS